MFGKKNVKSFLKVYREADFIPIKTQQINTVNSKYKQKYQIFQFIKHIEKQSH